MTKKHHTKKPCTCHTPDIESNMCEPYCRKCGGSIGGRPTLDTLMREGDKRFDAEFTGGIFSCEQDTGGDSEDYWSVEKEIKAHIHDRERRAYEAGRKDCFKEKVPQDLLDMAAKEMSDMAYLAGAEMMLEAFKEKAPVGFLRQWLNEERITDKKMVSDDDLREFLKIGLDVWGEATLQAIREGK